MPGGTVALVLLVVLLTALLAGLVLLVSVVGAVRARRAARLRDALVLGEAPDASLRRFRAVVAELAATHSPTDLRRLLPPHAREGLRVQALHDLSAPRWRTRLAAVRLLLATGPREPVVRLLDDPVAVVRAAACAAVGPGSDREALDAVAELLADDDPGVRHLASDALSRCGAAAAPSLAGLLATTPDTDVRAVALSLAVPGGGALLPQADAAAADPHPEVRRAAAVALAALGDPLGRLAGLVADPEPSVAAAACRSAGALRDPALARPLARALASPAWDVRTSAAGALAALGPAGRLLLRAAAQGPDAYARDAALAALGLSTVTVTVPVPA